MTVKEFIEALSKYPEDFEINAQVIRELPEEEMEEMRYPYPYEYIESEIEIIDCSYSDKTVNISMNI